MDASRVYVRALALGCFYSHISTRTFRRALTASLDSCTEIKKKKKKKKSPFSGVTKSGRVWKKVPESDVGSVVTDMVHLDHTASIAFGNFLKAKQKQKHPKLKEGCHKLLLGVCDRTTHTKRKYMQNNINRCNFKKNLFFYSWSGVTAVTRCGVTRSKLKEDFFNFIFTIAQKSCPVKLY